jgi:hypothetical protein
MRFQKKSETVDAMTFTVWFRRVVGSAFEGGVGHATLSSE